MCHWVIRKQFKNQIFSPICLLSFDFSFGDVFHAHFYSHRVNFKNLFFYGFWIFEKDLAHAKIIQNFSSISYEDFYFSIFTYEYFVFLQCNHVTNVRHESSLIFL